MARANVRGGQSPAANGNRVNCRWLRLAIMPRHGEATWRRSRFDKRGIKILLTNSRRQCILACVFPTLYPTGSADFRAERIKDVKPAKYFKHLLQYKNGRFVRHTRWWYFALNSQMRWQALQEGKVYVKQNLTDAQITVTDIQERITQGDNYMANRIMRFGEGLRGSCQFWYARCNELNDMIKQIELDGLIFLRLVPPICTGLSSIGLCHLMVIVKLQPNAITKISWITLISRTGFFISDLKFSLMMS
jgi:hypothetical protein